MKETIKIYAFIDNATGRDAEIVLPVGYALEKFHGCQVQYLFIWDIYLIRKTPPDIVLLPNCRGHHMYVEVAEYATENNIIVLALESEGNFKTDGSFDFWGYNTAKKIYQEWLCCWSERTQEYLQEEVVDEQERAKVVLSGGVGFDKYQLLQFPSKQQLLDKYHKGGYKKVIGYAGWAFGKIYGQHKNISFQKLFPDDPEKRFNWLEARRTFVRDTLKLAIESNPDILFILKRHPKESFESDLTEGLNEMNELIAYENVLYIRKEEEVHDLIGISDLWLGFKTTTATEAWLMHKPTILINDGHEYAIDNLYPGSIKVKSANQLQNYIDELYATQEIKDFQSPALQIAREQIIADSIGFGDGLNHMRAVKYFSKSLRKRESIESPKLNLRHLRLYILMHFGRHFYNKSIFERLAFFKKTVYVFENRGLPGFQELKDSYYKEMTNFHNKLAKGHLNKL